MSQTNVARLKMNPPTGSMPVLQYCAPDQLQVDADYQRSLDSDRARRLIRNIAAHWDWGLCQPLFVARRGDGGLFVVDGQHRLAAAKLRGDIWQLPCVVTHFATAADEAASFVALNQQRRPLNQLELFKAAIAAGEAEACQVARILDQAGLKLARTTNNQLMRAGEVGNVGGLSNCLRVEGERVLLLACKVLNAAWPGAVLRYAGSVFPGIAAVVADELRLRKAPDELVAELAGLIGAKPQGEWFKRMAAAIAEDTNLKRSKAAALVIRTAWRQRHSAAPAALAPPPTDLKPAESAWCDQCDTMVSGAKAAACASPFCSLKVKAA